MSPDMLTTAESGHGTDRFITKPRTVSAFIVGSAATAGVAGLLVYTLWLGRALPCGTSRIPEVDILALEGLRTSSWGLPPPPPQNHG
ncbi:hypothetical protein B0H63DRAFT_520576 [Podospora didyma]|uniref:Uncharacterized protein n=1 Tax=Podospora didyma TaxID=330526 RepID=A0AAE0U0K7_9PEZI|nr:hypothetical protein B0H63DRAFT_520576 [Podospora didyma]